MALDHHLDLARKSIVIAFILSILIAIYVKLEVINNSYQLLWLLPFGYFILTLVYSVIVRKLNYDYGLIFVIANIIIFIRYVITPFSIVFSQGYQGIGYGPNPSRSSMSSAIMLMLVELLSVYLFSYFTIFHYKKKQQSELIPQERQSTVLNNNFVVAIFLLLMIPIVLLLSPNALLPKSFEAIENASMSAPEIPFVGLFLVIIPVVRLSLLLFGLAYMKRRYDKNKKTWIIILSWMFIFIYLGTLLSTSRWTLLFSSILCLVIMAKLFPKTSRIFYVLLISFSIVAFLSISIYKFSWAIQTSENPFRDIIKVIFGQFQEYFSGPRVVAQSIDMVSAFHNQFTIKTLLNDFFGSIPLVAKLVDQTDRINVYFNYYLQVPNISHIIPMIGNGYAYFPYFPMIFSMIAQMFMIRFDYEYKRRNCIEFQYIYAYTGLFFAMSMGFNVQIIFGNFFSNFLIPWLLFTINSKVVVTKSMHRNGGNDAFS